MLLRTTLQYKNSIIRILKLGPFFLFLFLHSIIRSGNAAICEKRFMWCSFCLKREIGK